MVPDFRQARQRRRKAKAAEPAIFADCRVLVAHQHAIAALLLVLLGKVC